MHTTESDSAVECTPQSFWRNFHLLTLRCDVHRGSLTPRWHAHCGVWLRCMMHTVESDSAVGCTPQRFLKIRISQHIGNRIQKYFSLFIMGLDGFELRIMKKNGGRKSRDTLPLRKHFNLFKCNIVNYSTFSLVFFLLIDYSGSGSLRFRSASSGEIMQFFLSFKLQIIFSNNVIKTSTIWHFLQRSHNFRNILL